jgi:hypothetical protein
MIHCNDVNEMYVTVGDSSMKMTVDTSYSHGSSVV